MSAPLARLVGAFVAPARTAPPRAERTVPSPPSPPAIALLCAPGDAGVLGAALALALGRARPAVVCRWGASAPRGPRAPVGPRTAALARSLGARGLEASARGRLAEVALPEAPSEAARAAARAGTLGAPVVTVLAGPRARPLDGLLDEQDVIVVAVGSHGRAPLGELALAGLAGCRAPAVLCEVRPGGLAGVLAVAGMGAGGPLGAVATEVAELRRARA